LIHSLSALKSAKNGWLAYRDRYGPIFTVWSMVMLSDSELILETIKHDSLAYAGRFFFTLNVISSLVIN
jgi:hypothetical protein